MGFFWRLLLGFGRLNATLSNLWSFWMGFLTSLDGFSHLQFDFGWLNRIWSNFWSFGLDFWRLLIGFGRFIGTLSNFWKFELDFCNFSCWFWLVSVGFGRFIGALSNFWGFGLDFLNYLKGFAHFQLDQVDLVQLYPISECLDWIFRHLGSICWDLIQFLKLWIGFFDLFERFYPFSIGSGRFNATWSNFWKFELDFFDIFLTWNWSIYWEFIQFWIGFYHFSVGFLVDLS